MKFLRWLLSITLIVGVVSSINLSSGSATGRDFKGPESGQINVDSAPFFITLDAPVNENRPFKGEIVGGGISGEVTVNFGNGEVEKGFTIRPTEMGTVTLLAKFEGGPQSDRTLSYNVLPAVEPTPSPTLTVTPTPGDGGSNGTGGTGGNGSISGNGVPTISLPLGTANTGGSNSSDGAFGVLDYGLQIAPFSVKYDPRQELVVTFEVPFGDGSKLVTIWLPKRATDEAVMLEVQLGQESDQFQLDDLDLLVSLFSLKDGKSISFLKQAMQIRPWFDVRIPRLVENGGCSAQFIALRTAYLPSNQSAGYFPNQSGYLTLFTRQLSKVTNLALSNGEQLCSPIRKGISFSPREFNRVIAEIRNNSPYLMIDLKEKFAGMEMDLFLRRTVDKETIITKIASLRVNSTADALLPYNEKILKSDRFRVQIGRFPLAIKTVTLNNP